MTGSEAVHSIPVAVSGISLFRLVPTPAGGSAPLSVGFTLSGAPPLATASLDLEGDGVVDFTAAALEGPTFVYPVPGLYYPHVTVVTAEGDQLTAATVVHVVDAQALAATLRAKWAAFRAALAAGDIEAAVTFVGETYKDKYRRVFTDLAPDLPTVAAELRDLEVVTLTSTIAEFATTQDPDGATYVHLVYFLRDIDGIWKLASL